METFLKPPSSFKFLVVHDIDASSTSKLSERFVPQAPYYDAILVIGPLYQEEIETKQDEAVALGDIASLLAQLENIVCRVIYLPAENDPLPLLLEQTHLTPNSIGIHGRRLNLTSNLYVLGFTEKSDTSKVDPRANPSLEPNEEEIENLEIVSGISTDIIRNMLIHRTEVLPLETVNLYPVDHAQSVNDVGIFLLNYRYAHTLNQFLFHMNDEIESANIDLCIIVSHATNDIARLPKKFGKLSIVAPKSLRQGYFTTVEISRVEGGKWTTTMIEHHQL